MRVRRLKNAVFRMNVVDFAAGHAPQSIRSSFVIVLSFLAIGSVSGVDEYRCPNDCSGHGLCSLNSACDCFQGFVGPDCSERSCPHGVSWFTEPNANHLRSLEDVECSDGGLCDRSTGLCLCHTAFSGPACERMACAGSLNRTHFGAQDDPFVKSGGGHFMVEPCSGHGVCRTLAEAAELRNDYNLMVSVEYTLWDANKIQGCVCDRGWEGYDCSQRQCPSGDDPFTFGVNGVQKVACDCVATDCSGYFTLSFRGSDYARIDATATASEFETALNALPELGGVAVSYHFDDNNDADSDGVVVEADLSGASICNSNSVFAFVEFEYDHGSVPLLRVGTNSVSQVTDANITISQYVDDTKENVVCNNHGQCNTKDGTCTCDDMFFSSDGAGGYASFTSETTLSEGISGDCGFTDLYGLDEVSFLDEYTCPSSTDQSCSGHGRCNLATMQCACYDGFTGHDCQHQLCPFGSAWFDEASADDVAHARTECSNRGICNRQMGECMCQEGFVGAACERLACPQNNEGQECNGYGQCVSMRSLSHRRRNSQGVLDALEYGSSFDSADRFVHASAWDSQHIYGCVCDREYNSMASSNEVGMLGFDCSQRKCRTGVSEADLSEPLASQSVRCSLGSDAYFQLTFREDTTAWISSGATAEEVQFAVEDLGTIGLVSINGTGCNIDISFGSELTNVPLLQYNVRGTDSDSDGFEDETLDITVITEGSRTELECSGNGVCNRDTGLCECFYGFTSSDGDGGLGTRDDCGYLIPEGS